MKKLAQDSSTSAMSALHHDSDLEEDARVTSYLFSYKGNAESPEVRGTEFFHDHSGSPTGCRLSDVGPHVRSTH